MPRGSYKIRAKRKQLGLSQVHLAARADLAVRTVQFVEGGKEQVTLQTIKRIAGALELELQDAICDDDAIQDDRFESLPWSFSKFIQERVVPGADSICESREHAIKVIRQMRESWKVHLDSTQSYDNQNVFGAAEEMLSGAMDDYIDRYLEIWDRLPSTLQLATEGDSIYGASVVLPVTDDAFERLQDGEITFMDIGADDILDQSQNIVLDSVVEFTGTGNPAWHKVSANLSYVVLCQIASHSVSPVCDTFRMVSFGASPLNMKRLLSSGFQMNGSVMPTYEYPLCTFSVRDHLPSKDYIASSTTAHFAHLVKSYSLSKFAARSRRRVITNTLGVLKNLTVSAQYSGHAAGAGRFSQLSRRLSGWPAVSSQDAGIARPAEGLQVRADAPSSPRSKLALSSTSPQTAREIDETEARSQPLTQSLHEAG
ncbi:Transcriptional regulator, contains XRE-family HTH domain [Neorhodopirellula lusitana]|uniref:Transcriptional regulator, contains XRE-family HTH domain n=1 Tax=Neorhodopirellula lusitana TaxID=445327 RepID=A0ABY1QLF4_9BACT|nr:helix-turn-helix domain-containing protein [Neorhodopirellula lusitana]SMP74772.1 Transcriptional regulator, contains XRE-family HTH domain [Neorhodopirellula lusitana]